MNHRIKLTRLFAFVSLCVYQNRSLSLLRTVNIAAILIFLVNLFFGQIQIIIRWQQLKRNRVKLEIDKKKKNAEWTECERGPAPVRWNHMKFNLLHERWMTWWQTKEKWIQSVLFFGFLAVWCDIWGRHCISAEEFESQNVFHVLVWMQKKKTVHDFDQTNGQTKHPSQNFNHK